MKRGDRVLAAAAGDYGKPRPHLIVQADAFSRLASVTALPLTTALQKAPLFRVAVEPSPKNGLRVRSQIMIDKTVTVRVERMRETIGRVERETMLAVDKALLVFLGLA